MAGFVRGDIVVVPFPFSDLTTAKRRPALVLAALEGDDLILCQITSRMTGDPYAVPIEDRAFTEGGLRQSSNVRPNRVFTADSHIVLYKIGGLKPEKLDEVTEGLIRILRA